MPHSRYIRAVTAFVLFLFIAATSPVSAAGAATLYERSLTLLLEKLPQTPAEDFTFVVMGDSRDDDAVFKKALALAVKAKPLFILHTGDVSSRGSEREIEHFLDLVRNGASGIPLFVVIGNHEKGSVFEKLIGPRQYTLDLARLDTRLIVDDNSAYSLKKPQLDYLKRQLAAAPGLVFVSLHIPPKTERWSWHTFSEGADDLIRLLGERKAAMAFFGHIHLFDEDVLQGVKYVVTGGAGAPLIRFGFSGEASHHIVVVRVKNGTVSHQMVRIDK